MAAKTKRASKDSDVIDSRALTATPTDQKETHHSCEISRKAKAISKQKATNYDAERDVYGYPSLFAFIHSCREKTSVEHMQKTTTGFNISFF
jgi:hypothetical protein